MQQSDQFAEKRRFITRLGKALHKYGTPAYRLEAHLTEVSQTLGLHSHFMATPTFLTFVLSEGEESQDYHHIVRVSPGELDLGSLARIDALVDEVTSEQKTLTEAIERLDDIANKPIPYSRWLMFMAFGGASGAFAMLMQSNWTTIFWSTVMGFIVYFITLWSEKSARVANMLEPFIAFVTALLISAIADYDPRVDVHLVILSSIIVYIPGLALTMGLSELAARNLVSGTARVVDAVMSLFKLYFGALLGLAMAGLIWSEPVVLAAAAPSAWVSWIAVTILSLSLIILFKTRVKDAPWGMISGYVSFGATLWGGLYLGPALGAFIGAFVLGLYSNLFSRLMNLPSSIVMLLGLVMLVPGSKVYIGLNQAVSGQAMLNVSDIGVQSFLIFMSLVAGLIFADVVLPTQKRL